MKRVMLESPYAGEVEKNIEYARKCVRHCLSLGEAPFVSHLLYTQEGILDDKNPSERKIGMEAGHSWLQGCEKIVIYIDRGVSKGMFERMAIALEMNIPFEVRSIEEETAKEIKEEQNPLIFKILQSDEYLYGAKGRIEKISEDIKKGKIISARDYVFLSQVLNTGKVLELQKTSA